ncbi:unnamed protein product [Heligmosomoides polygyrus]|uniref:HTH_48 domain-containing protein n=1 Tax=Heligmosomoides polygyrus TaxID=6339 RepID=A0A3P7ZA59_HELPZ|nr:unnamed protein product [Heligmosomoides polygyrus]
MDKRVIRGIYLYEFKLGTTAKEADEKINAAFGQGCSTIRTAYRWYQKFRNVDESLEEHEGRGRHSDVDEDKLRDVVEEDPHKGTREIAKVLGVSHNTAARHLKEIGKTKKLERWVPHELSEEQRNRRYEISLRKSFMNPARCRPDALHSWSSRCPDCDEGALTMELRPLAAAERRGEPTAHCDDGDANCRACEKAFVLRRGACARPYAFRAGTCALQAYVSFKSRDG